MARTAKIKIINILLSSLDGKIAAHEFESSEDRRISKFTNQTDFHFLQEITSQCDAVFIGAKSIESERGAFRVAHLRQSRTEPHWFVFTKSGEVNYNHPFWTQKDIPKSLFQYHTPDHLKDFLKTLNTKNINTIALLGGGKLNGLFWSLGLVDELYLTVSPYLIGKKLAPGLVESPNLLNAKLKLLKHEKKNSFLFLHYKVLKNKNENKKTG